jgi:hypothetical protein
MFCQRIELAFCLLEGAREMNVRRSCGLGRDEPSAVLSDENLLSGVTRMRLTRALQTTINARAHAHDPPEMAIEC